MLPTRCGGTTIFFHFGNFELKFSNSFLNPHIYIFTIQGPALIRTGQKNEGLVHFVCWSCLGRPIKAVQNFLARPYKRPLQLGYSNFGYFDGQFSRSFQVQFGGQGQYQISFQRSVWRQILTYISRPIAGAYFGANFSLKCQDFMARQKADSYSRVRLRRARIYPIFSPF